MLTERSSTDPNFSTAFVKFGRGALGGTAAANRPHIKHVRGSLTILGYGKLSKDRVVGIPPKTTCLGTTMARDAYEWHGVCFYGVGGNHGRADVVSMDYPFKASGSLDDFRDQGRGSRSLLSDLAQPADLAQPGTFPTNVPVAVRR